MNTSSTLHLLSGGAAQGLVSAVRMRFEADPGGPEGGCVISAGFGAVGSMVERLLAGDPCDVLIVTEALIAQLTDMNHLSEGSARALGVVKTGIAVQHGQAMPQVDTPKALEMALLAASGIYFPDPVKSTAGIHFMKVLKSLGIADEVASRLRPFPNGATAMREMAAAKVPGAIGCTQVTEILYTPGVKLVGLLPAKFELATVYTAAVGAHSAIPERAALLVGLLSGPDAAFLRKTAGFE